MLASAGSGKTMSLLGKIEYLHNRLGIPAGRILVISFTQKTVTELKERCSIDGVEIRTFHSLGNSLLRSNARTNVMSKRLIADVQVDAFIRNYCELLVKGNAKFGRSFTDFVLFYYPIPTEQIAVEEQRIAD